MVKVAAFDPGFKRDAFAMVAANVTSDHIKLINAKEWWNKDIIIIAEKIRSIHNTAKFERFICEANNQGYPVIDVLRQKYSINCVPITTVKALSNKEKIRQGKSMPKNVTVEWVEWARKSGVLVMPKKPLSFGLKRLDQQMSRYIRKSTASSTKYEAAEEEDHDDLVSALLILCHYARTKILSIGYRGSTLITSSRAYDALNPKLNTPEEKVTDNIKKRMSRHFPNGMMDDMNIDVGLAKRQ